MATKSPSPEARDNASMRPLSDGLRSAIAESGLSLKTLERASGVCSSSIGEFLRSERIIILETADQLAAGVGLAVARRGVGVGDKPPARRFSDPLLTAIDGCGLSPYKIAKAAGIPEGTVSSFLRRGRSMYLPAADRLCITLDLEVVSLARVEAPPRAKPSAQPFEEALRSSFAVSGLTINALERASGVNKGSIGRFFRRQATISMDTADRLAGALGVEFPRVGDEPPVRHLSDGLRSAIDGCGLSRTALVEASGVDFSTIRRFMCEETTIDIETADRLAGALGVKVSFKPVDRNLGRPVLNIGDARTSLESLRSAIDGCGLSLSEISRRSGVEPASIRNLIARRGSPHYLTVAKLSAALGFDPVTATSHPLVAEVSSSTEFSPSKVTEVRTEPSPWDDWDATTCPVHVREDSHLVVFERPKIRLRSRNVTRLVSGLAERYPVGGFDNPGLKKRFGSGAVAAFHRLKKIDADCEAAFQSAEVKNGSLYRIGKSDN